MPMIGQFVTDTSTLAIFDPEALRHRIDDVGDWWTYPDEEVLSEMNRGNVGIVDLGTDGIYELRSVEDIDPQVSIKLRTPSSRIFIGAGEEISGGGLQPEGIRGFFIDFHFEAALLHLRRIHSLIEYKIEPYFGSPCNSFSSWTRLE